MTPKEKAKDKRLRKTYGWTLEMYNKLLELQGGVCYGCGNPPKKASLNVDHRHFKVQIGGSRGAWYAAVPELTPAFFYAETKAECIRQAKEFCMPFSVRGLLCAGRHGTGCNTKLGRIDNAKWLRKMADYLDDPPARKIL